MMLKKKKQETVKDVLLQPKADRRLLAHVPDPENIRSLFDRRGEAAAAGASNGANTSQKNNAGQRYIAHFPVELSIVGQKGEHSSFTLFCSDISMTGILLTATRQEHSQAIEEARRISLRFKIPAGALEEGMESRVRINGRFVRKLEQNGEIGCALRFDTPLDQYLRARKDAYALTMSAVFLFLVTLTIMLMRAESVLYFRFNRFLYLYSIITAIFLLTRYLFGALYRPVPVNPDFTPGVTIIVPCYNEEEWIQETIFNAVDQDYPMDKLEVLIVDDFSTDRSVEMAQKALDKLYAEAERFKTKERVRLIRQPKNAGKREALAVGAKAAKHELIVFVDSDSFLAPDAIRNLVQPFQDPKMGGVSGRTDVANTYTNNLTKMQSVRYYIAFRIMKAAEAYFDAVTCLSGPLSCYKKSIVLEHMDAWLNQRFLGQRATFGDDRAITNFVLRKHRTSYQDSAICNTIVPNRHAMFLKQQMRWKRSWLRESTIAATFIWKKEPLASIFFYMGLLTPVLAPVVVIYNLLIVPIFNGVFPGTFLLGLLLMAMMMSFCHLFFKKSSIWLHGLWFCLYYEFVLLWQMPIAWFTFWKSTWGTRLTPEDMKAQAARKGRKKKHNKGEEPPAPPPQGEPQAAKAGEDA